MNSRRNKPPADRLRGGLTTKNTMNEELEMTDKDLELLMDVTDSELSPCCNARSLNNQYCTDCGDFYA